MAKNTQFRLNTGAHIPAVGFGTWQDAGQQEQAVQDSVNVGYRHIDTAAVYGTEPAIGRALKKSGVPRDQLFITSKLWNNMHHPDDVAKGLDISLKDLGTDYLDLYLMHWPVAFARGDNKFPKTAEGKTATIPVDYVDTYKAMEKLLQTGKVKAIGISNFSRAELERLLKETTIVPAVHQIELHPWLQQPSFKKLHEQKGIHITQYSSLGNQNELYQHGEKFPPMISDPVLQEIGKKIGKTPAQVALAWGIAKGNSVLVKSKTPSRIKENLESDFVLAPEYVKQIDNIDKKRRFNDSSVDFGYDFYTDLDGKKIHFR